MRKILAILLAAVALLGLGVSSASADSYTTPNRLCDVSGGSDYNVSITWARPTSTTTRPTLVTFKNTTSSQIATVYPVQQAIVHYSGLTERTASGLNSSSGTYTFIAGSMAKRVSKAYVVLLLSNGKSCQTNPNDPFVSF